MNKLFNNKTPQSGAGEHFVGRVDAFALRLSGGAPGDRALPGARRPAVIGGAYEDREAAHAQCSERGAAPLAGAREAQGKNTICT